MSAPEPLLARNYVENLREEVKKGMREKAEQGGYPGHAALGFKNNSATRSIEINPETSRIIQEAFELYGTGNYSLGTLRQTVLAKTGLKISKAHLEKTASTSAISFGRGSSTRAPTNR